MCTHSIHVIMSSFSFAPHVVTPHVRYNYLLQSIRTLLSHSLTLAEPSIHTDVDEMVLTPSTTVALNMVGEGLVSSKFLRPGARALTTDQEHGGGTAWLTHWQTAGVVGPIDKVAVPYGLGATAASVIAAFGEALQRAEAAGEKYSVVFASHVLTTTGVALPLVDIASLVHAHGAMFVVDGAQAPGGLSLDLHATGADVYTVSAHKWLLAPTGSGLLYLRAGRTQRAVLPTYLDGGYTAYSTSTGTLPLQTVAGLGYVLDMFAGLGMDRVAAHNLALREVLYSALTEMVASLVARDPALYAGLEIISPHAAGGVTSPIVALNLPPAVLLNTDACAALSADYGVVVKLMSDYEGGNDFVVNAIRMTTHVFNTREDVSKLMTGLSTLLGA